MKNIRKISFIMLLLSLQFAACTDNFLEDHDCSNEGTVKSIGCGIIIVTINNDTIYPAELPSFTFRDGQKVQFSYRELDCCSHGCLPDYRDSRCFSITCIKEVKKLSNEPKPSV